MKTIIRLFIPALALLLSTASWAEDGRGLFSLHCSGCHGMGGEGGRGLFSLHCSGCHGMGGEGGRGPALRKAGLLITVEQGYFIKSIRVGRVFRGCPPFSGKIPPEGIESIASYVKSWQTGEMLIAPGHDVEARHTERGEGLFKLCGGCHGTEGEGAMGPPLLDPGFLESISDTELRRTIMWGRPGTPMKGYMKGMGGLAELEVTEIDEIISYMRYRQKAAGGTDAQRIKAP